MSNSKKLLLKAILAILVGFAGFQIWGVTTYHPGYMMTTEAGDIRYVMPSFKIDAMQLVYKFYDKK